MSAERMNISIDNSSTSLVTRTGVVSLQSAFTTVQVGPRRSSHPRLTLEHLEVLKLDADS